MKRFHYRDNHLQEKKEQTMKHAIYYFSGTGNSLYVAKKIQDRLGGAELIQITAKSRDKRPIVTADVLGIVFPVYAFGPPKLVEEFIKTAQLGQPGYLFVVATNAGGPGNTLKYTEKLFKQKGLSVHGAFEIKMPINYITGSNPPSPEEAKTIVEAQLPKLSAISTAVAEQKTKVASGDSMLKTALIHPIFTTFAAKQQAKKFSVSDQCTGCGFCEKLCPVENIRLDSDQKPSWGTACEFCLGCINWCPVQAIESGRATQGRNRYHHPDIRVQELFT
jgi:flavodoxin/Pyruvate/2-oxoacid:ferredoxin oxidoreductase delta subunit